MCHGFVSYLLLSRWDPIADLGIDSGALDMPAGVARSLCRASLGGRLAEIVSGAAKVKGDERQSSLGERAGTPLQAHVRKGRRS